MSSWERWVVGWTRVRSSANHLSSSAFRVIAATSMGGRLPHPGVSEEMDRPQPVDEGPALPVCREPFSVAVTGVT